MNYRRSVRAMKWKVNFDERSDVRHNVRVYLMLAGDKIPRSGIAGQYGRA